MNKLTDHVFDVEKIIDPTDRALAVNSRIEELQGEISALSQLRRLALEELLSNGMSQTQVADVLGMSRSRISQLLAVGTRPERAFLGTGRLTVAIGAKREDGTKASISEMVSAECFAAYEILSEAARTTGLDASQEIVPPPGIVHLNRTNLIVLTNPRLLPFLSQVMEADPSIRFTEDDFGNWYLTDVRSGEDYRSPKDSGGSIDYGYIGRLPRPDGKGTFLYLAGTHAQGTLGAVTYLVDNLPSLYKELKTRRFSTIIACEVKAKKPLQIITTERLTPLYRHDGA